MDNMQNPMQMNMSNAIYWRKDQIAITFPSHLALSASRTDIVLAVDTLLQMLNQQATKEMPFKLERLSKGERAPTDDLTGISLYASPTYSGAHTPATQISVFCTVNPTAETEQEKRDAILKVVRKLNIYERSGQAQQAFRATPHWLWSGVPDYDPTHGCPVTPPFPVEDGGRSGQWMTRFPMLPDELQKASGAGVTVFILDAFPAPEQILFAANAAGTQNTLLQQMALGLVSHEPFQAAPPAISLNYTYEIPGPDETAVTGKDIYGRLSAFPLADHGLFIAGLVRDIVPDASIECVRILNDFAVGETRILFQALADIEARLRAGNLQGQRVVINLSLVIGPPDCDCSRLGLTSAEVFSHLAPLHTLMLSMAQRGAVFVASVGNDSDPRDFSMNPSEMRFNARYPAAFGNDLSSIDPSFTPLRAIIPVGAVNQRGEPAVYSNYPGANGLATYGGEVPRPEPWLPSANAHQIAKVDPHFPIDALRGVYSAPAYPALSRNDPYPKLVEPPPAAPTTYPQYPATQTSAWAYWSGTSFAAPLITGLAARALQGQSAPFDGASVHRVLASASQHTTWSGTETPGDVRGPMLMAMQEWEDK
ncbi:MAG: S8 family serine peptidase [Ktedonobacteraceae bacterium]